MVLRRERHGGWYTFRQRNVEIPAPASETYVCAQTVPPEQALRTLLQMAYVVPRRRARCIGRKTYPALSVSFTLQARLICNGRILVIIQIRLVHESPTAPGTEVDHGWLGTIQSHRS